MRTLTLFLAFATILACNSEKQDSKKIISQPNEDDVVQLTSYEDSLLNLLDYSDKFIDDLNQNKNNLTGKPRIPRGQAKARIALYKLFQSIDRASRNQNYDPKRDIYGFTFDLKNLSDFVKEIEAQNDDPNTNPDSIITGVRIYKSYRSIDDKPVREVFMVPTLKTGKNFYDIDDDLDVKSSEYALIIDELSKDAADDLILDSSVPCPNSCN